MALPLRPTNPARHLSQLSWAASCLLPESPVRLRPTGSKVGGGLTDQEFTAGPCSWGVGVGGIPAARPQGSQEVKASGLFLFLFLGFWVSLWPRSRISE